MIKIQSENDTFFEGQAPMTLITFSCDALFRLKSMTGYLEVEQATWKKLSGEEKQAYVLGEIKKDLFPEPFNVEKLEELRVQVAEGQAEMMTLISELLGGGQ